jgi:hypothetical protein
VGEFEVAIRAKHEVPENEVFGEACTGQLVVLGGGSTMPNPWDWQLRIFNPNLGF